MDLFADFHFEGVPIELYCLRHQYSKLSMGGWFGLGQIGHCSE